MHEAFFCLLNAERLSIRRRWVAFLRIEPISTPLAHPDMLVHYIDRALDEVLQILRDPSRRPSVTPAQCTCGRHPLLAFYRAGEQALLETLVLTQAAQPSLNAQDRDAAVSELKLAIHAVTWREIDAFSGLCLHRLETAQSSESIQ